MNAQPQLNPGAILAGRWQIQDFIGTSDTGEVYGVLDTHGTATFALKLFWPNALAQAEIWSAVQQTARTAAGLGKEGVARAYDFGIDANAARPFFVSERVSWSSLADRVRLRGPLAPAELATALAVVARALDAAHAAGVVHRDVKPENVFISPDNPNWVRVTDFGVALLRSASPPPPGWGGTVGWVAPDAADPNARSTPAMDVFSLGLVAFFALSGGALHRAARSAPIDAAALWQELTQPLDSASLRARELGASIDPAFDAWFQRAVAPMPEARFTSIAEMVSAFDAIVHTLVAPQSQNAVALPGIAAAIAQPLVFQPEPPLQAPSPAAAPPFEAAVPAYYAQRLEEAPSSALPGLRKRTAAPLLIGGAVLCLALTVLGIGALSHRRSVAAEQAAATALASASAAAAEASAASTAAAASAVSATAAASAAPSNTVAVAAAEPSATETPTAAAALPASVAGTPSSKASLAAKPATTPKPIATTPVKVATATPAKVAATPAKVAATPAKVAATPTKVAATPAKVAVANNPTSPSLKVTTKPALLAPPKKKCGSTFIPCK